MRNLLVAVLIVAASGAAMAADGLGLTGDQDRRLWALALSLGYLAFCLFFVVRWRRARAARQSLSGDDDMPLLLVFASQTGYAEELAGSTADVLRNAQVKVRTLPLSDVDDDLLAKTKRALFIVSTTGEGDPPDQAFAFISTVMSAPRRYDGLQYGVLALGDRGFERFCAFGETVDEWFAGCGARRMFEIIKVDRADAAALAAWSQRLSAVSGAEVALAADAGDGALWHLQSRRQANLKSSPPAYLVSLSPSGVLPTWQAGDIAMVRPLNRDDEIAGVLQRLHGDGQSPVTWMGVETTLEEALRRALLPDEIAEHGARDRQTVSDFVATLQPMPWREYSIASLPDEGRIDLLVRQVRFADGRLGIVSGRLTDAAPIGAGIDLKIRVNAAFHAPSADTPMIFIGNGTGIAGLRAHLAARAKLPGTRNWLLFGERTSADAPFFQADMARWQSSGVVERIDLAFSRDEPGQYVQDVLRQRSAELRAWVGDGAAIYVCGSLRGMAPAVHGVLEGVLGRDGLAELLRRGLYRRDVY